MRDHPAEAAGPSAASGRLDNFATADSFFARADLMISLRARDKCR